MAGTYSSAQIAQLLDRGAEWFYEHREQLQARGMPAPLDLPGHRQWSRAQIDAWLAGVDKRAVAGKLPLRPANDAAPVPAPEAAAWEPYLRQVYAAR